MSSVTHNPTLPVPGAVPHRALLCVVYFLAVAIAVVFSPAAGLINQNAPARQVATSSR